MYLIWVESLDLFKASALLCTESQPIDYSNYKTRLVSNSKSLLSRSELTNIKITLLYESCCHHISYIWVNSGCLRTTTFCPKLIMGQ